MHEAGFKGRREDLRLLTGAGRYTADCDFPGQHYAYFLRADRAHALLRGMNVAAARECPGVVAVFTGADLAGAGFKTHPTLVSFPGRGGVPIKVPAHPVLAIERVRFVGDLVALVVATSALAAQDAAERIVVDYEDLPAVAHAADAIQPDAPRVHDEIEGNVCFDHEYGDLREVEAAFARAAHVTRLSLSSQRVVGNPIELRACVAAYDRAHDRYDLYLPNQGAAMMRAALMLITGLPADKLRIHPLDVGGAFGVRGSPQPEYAALMFASRVLGRPVKWVASRSESFLADTHGRAIQIEAALALDGDGRFTAIRAHWLCDQGAYLTPSGPLINSVNGSLGITGCYRIPAAYGRHRLALTHTSPISAYRGAGRPDAAYTVERLVDQAAVELRRDPVELRRLNLIPKDAFPYVSPTKAVYDSGDYPALLEHALRASRWDEFEARRVESRARGKLRGIGCAVFLEPSGGGKVPKDQIAIVWEQGKRVVLYAVTQSAGQGHESAFAEIVAQTLGLPAELVQLRAGDVEGARDLVGSGVTGSRSTMHSGSALKLAALEMVRKGRLLAARKLEAAPEDIEFSAGVYSIQGTDRSVTLAELARINAHEAAHPLDVCGEQPVARAFPSGAHVAEVEIDPETGMTEVLAYTAVDDCGVVINHTLAQGQVHGGVLQGAGQVFGEHALYDRASGQLLNGSFMDYTMPRAELMTSIHDLYHCVPSPTNVLGVKGIGEAGTTGALPTLMNALMDALRREGVAHFDMPASPLRVWEALRAARLSVGAEQE